MQPAIRRVNGTIDIDHYRNIATGMRRDASIELLRGARSGLWVMAASAALLLTVVVFGAHRSPDGVRTASSATTFTR